MCIENPNPSNEAQGYSVALIRNLPKDLVTDGTLERLLRTATHKPEPIVDSTGEVRSVELLLKSVDDRTTTSALLEGNSGVGVFLFGLINAANYIEKYNIPVHINATFLDFQDPNVMQALQSFPYREKLIIEIVEKYPSTLNDDTIAKTIIILQRIKDLSIGFAIDDLQLNNPTGEIGSAQYLELLRLNTIPLYAIKLDGPAVISQLFNGNTDPIQQVLADAHGKIDPTTLIIAEFVESEDVERCLRKFFKDYFPELASRLCFQGHYIDALCGEHFDGRLTKIMHGVESATSGIVI